MTNLHFSVDDFIDNLLDLNNYNSLFEQPVFKKLLNLHTQYNISFSCYCFYENKNGNLSQVTVNFSKEFQQNSSWLKFGFHALNYDTNYGSTKFVSPNAIDNYEIAKEHYTKVIDELVRITGSGNCIDQIPRIHYYAGTLADCQGWKDAPYGIKGLISSEDNRICYYHTSEQTNELLNNGIFYDKINNLTFLRTSIRLENIKNDEDFSKILKSKQNYKNILIFTHEKFLKQDDIINKISEIMKIYKKQKNKEKF